MSIKELETQITELKQLTIMADELAAEITSMEDELKAEMTARDTEEIITATDKVRWKPVTSNRLDTTRFKTDHADLYAAYVKTTQSKRFSIA